MMSGSIPNDALSRDIREEGRRLRWLRVQSDLIKAVLYQDRDLNLAEARRLVYDFRRRVLEVFPGDDRTFDMLLLPRFERVIRERWGQDLDPMIH
jgi:hypothetical protein